MSGPSTFPSTSRSSIKAENLSRPITQLRHASSEGNRTRTQPKLSRQLSSDSTRLNEVHHDKGFQSDGDVSPPESMIPTPEMGNTQLPGEDNSSAQEQTKPGIFSDADLEKVITELNERSGPEP